MKKNILLFLALVLVLLPTSINARTMSDYTSYPSFITIVKPNLGILLDNSGSVKVTACWNPDVPRGSGTGLIMVKKHDLYMDVDYKGNSNLLKEAIEQGVKSFQYISAINGDNLRQLKIFEAKEKFVDELKDSGMKYCVLRPNGFFSDMKDFLEMAKRGKVYLFGDGNFKMNPIHGEDLAKVCIDKMVEGVKEESIGGPELFTHNELAELALKAWKKPDG